MAEQMERYEDMMEKMMEFTKLGSVLTSKERNLLSVAFKNVVGSKRSSWRIISNIEEQDQILTSYLSRISSEIELICNQVAKLIDDYLLNSEDEESRTFYLKMKGDYFRYAAEVTLHEQRQNYAKSASEAYSEAYDVSRSAMDPPHPIRLGLALNYSVFFYEIEDQKTKACEIAKQAFDEAIGDMESVKMSSFKDSSLILQLLRDNLTLWTSDESDDVTEADDTAEAGDVIQADDVTKNDD